MHTVLLLLLGLSIGMATVNDGAGGRGLLLWLLLLVTVGIRELAKALACAWYGVELRGLLLSPTGAVVSYAGAARPMEPRASRWIGYAGPFANLLFAGVLASLVGAISPRVDLLARPWITPAYLIRSFYWLNVLMGVVHLLPAGLLGRRGSSILNGSPAEGLVEGAGGEVDAIRMREIMLMQFSTIPASDTLEDALERSVHTLQDVFPVVRGSNIVGAISRQRLVEALAAGGNSYVQGVMTRSLETAGPDDAVVKTLRRIIGAQGIQLVPVIEGERVIGIITPQNLAQAMSLVNRRRRLRQAGLAE